MNLKGVLSDDDIEALRARNASRVEDAIQALGHRWLLHPSRGVRAGVPAVPQGRAQPVVLRTDRMGDRGQQVAVLRRPKYGVAR